MTVARYAAELGIGCMADRMEAADQGECTTAVGYGDSSREASTAEGPGPGWGMDGMVVS